MKDKGFLAFTKSLYSHRFVHRWWMPPGFPTADWRVWVEGNERWGIQSSGQVTSLPLSVTKAQQVEGMKPKVRFWIKASWTLPCSAAPKLPQVILICPIVRRLGAEHLSELWDCSTGYLLKHEAQGPETGQYVELCMFARISTFFWSD
jgi:hypothetical protein